METAISIIGEPENAVAHVRATNSSMTPLQMLSAAIERGADMALLEKLMDLQERWQANEARKAFDAAMSDARAEITPITKGQHVEYQNKTGDITSYDHENLADIAVVVDPILARHGLSYRYRATSNLNEPIRCTCIVSHRLGHFEENTLQAGADSSGGKNSIQAIGSTLTYLQRYTLKAALGLSASKDDDGKSVDQTPSEYVSDEQAAILRNLITSTNTKLEKFLEVAKAESVSDVLAKDFMRLKNLLEDKQRKNGGAK